MIKHSEQRLLPYSREQMFELVADIESYPAFIPWCAKVKVTSEKNDEFKKCNVVEADMRVSFKVISETFSSRVFLDRNSREIIVTYLTGPFKYLNNKWTFKESADGCLVSFNVEFEFKSRIMQRLIGVVFHEAMRRIVKSFEKRAEELFD